MLMNRSTMDGRTVSAKARRDGTATSSAKRRAAGSDGGASPAALVELGVPFKEVLPRDNESLIRAGLGDGFCARCSDLPCPRWIVDNIAEAFRELVGVARIGDEKMDSISQLFTVPLLVGDFL